MNVQREYNYLCLKNDYLYANKCVHFNTKWTFQGQVYIFKYHLKESTYQLKPFCKLIHTTWLLNLKNHVENNML
jgi:hypothetical protein